MTTPTKLRADELLKHNITALLNARGQTRSELSLWCRQSRSWVDKWMTEPRRSIPAKHLDRIADFFGIATYQLLQPGISALTERRSGVPRRKLHDRRISNQVLAERQADVDLMQVIRLIDSADLPEAINLLADLANKRLRFLRARVTEPAEPDRTRRNDGATFSRHRAKPSDQA